MDSVQLGERLRAARENRGLKQEEAAEAILVPRTAIVHMEAGKRAVSTRELAGLADLYGRPIAEFFAEHEPEEEDVLLALYRLDPAIKETPEVRKEVLRAVGICQEGISLEKLLGREARVGPPAYKLAAPSNVIAAVKQGVDIAEEERERLGLGKAPVRDIAEIISNQGIWAAAATLPSEMSGLFLRHPSIGMAILVNESHAEPRKRFSYAHEYAHALLDRERSATVSTSQNSSELSEKRANAFAAAFLMPKAAVEGELHKIGKGLPSREVFPVYSVADDKGVEAQGRPPAKSQEITYQDVAVIAHHFGVSYQAAVYRLRSLSFVTKQECEGLLSKDELARSYLKMVRRRDSLVSGKTVAAGRADDRELVSQVLQLAVEAYRREEVSRGRLLDIAKKLGVDSKELLKQAEAAKDNP